MKQFQQLGCFHLISDLDGGKISLSPPQTLLTSGAVTDWLSSRLSTWLNSSDGCLKAPSCFHRLGVTALFRTNPAISRRRFKSRLVSLVVSISPPLHYPSHPPLAPIIRYYSPHTTAATGERNGAATVAMPTALSTPTASATLWCKLRTRLPAALSTLRPRSPVMPFALLAPQAINYSDSHKSDICVNVRQRSLNSLKCEQLHFLWQWTSRWQALTRRK